MKNFLSVITYIFLSILIALPQPVWANDPATQEHQAQEQHRIDEQVVVEGLYGSTFDIEITVQDKHVYRLIGAPYSDENNINFAKLTISEKHKFLEKRQKLLQSVAYHLHNWRYVVSAGSIINQKAIKPATKYVVKPALKYTVKPVLSAAGYVIKKAYLAAKKLIKKFKVSNQEAGFAPPITEVASETIAQDIAGQAANSDAPKAEVTREWYKLNLRDRSQALVFHFLSKFDKNLWANAERMMNRNEYGFAGSVGVARMTGVGSAVAGGMNTLGVQATINKDAKAFYFEVFIDKDALKFALIPMAQVGLVVKAGAVFLTRHNNIAQLDYEGRGYYPPVMPLYATLGEKHDASGFSTGIGLPPPPFDNGYSFATEWKRKVFMQFYVDNQLPYFHVRGPLTEKIREKYKDSRLQRGAQQVKSGARSCVDFLRKAG